MATNAKTTITEASSLRVKQCFLQNVVVSIKIKTKRLKIELSGSEVMLLPAREHGQAVEVSEDEI